MASDVKWIKITTDIFDDEKILLIESLPDAYSIIVVWFKLLCLAGKMNNSGVFIMNEKIVYTDKTLATIFRMKESTVAMALQTFEQFGMVEVVDGVITIPNWGKHQNLDAIESKKEYMRKYMQEYREKQKRLLGNGKLCENGLPLDEWKAVLEFFGHECAYCGAKEGLEQEHIIPFNNGGEFKIGNIVPACRKCNASKGSKNAAEWYAAADVFDGERFKKINAYMCKTNVNDLHKSNVSRTDKEEDKELELEGEKNIYCPAKQDGAAEKYREIVDYLNEKAGTSYRPTTKKTQTCIRARLKEGFTVDDFKRVIDLKCAEWIGDDRFERFLRPETLFGTKFEDYLNGKGGGRGGAGTNRNQNAGRELIGNYI